ncbi:MAG: arginine--tRNA ligase, partial [Alphaproteobacteria bacterium]|nr:arginine--tRNA ligase [Alphaproteobacteria bacterium]
EVVREYYVNDAGAQLDKLTRSVFLRYRQALGESVVDFPDDLYPGDYLISFGEELASQFGDSLCDESKHFSFVRSFIISEMMKTIRSDLSALGIDHDVFFFESTLHSGVPSDIELIVEELKKKSLIYKGILPPPKGGPQEDWEDREQTLFCASAFGDDMDRPLVKSDGNYTYFTADIAYFRNKLNRGFQKMIYVLGADHDGYVKRLEAIAGAVAEGKAEVFVRLCRLVRLYRGGEKVKMSKRAGHFVTLNEVVSEVGPDAVRFMMLFRSHDAPLDFDFAKVVEQSHENPVFYVQYAHARACSVLRKAGDILPVSCFSASAISGENFSILVDESEVSLIRKLSAFRSVLERAVLSHEPHRIAFYLYELAGEFHALWNKGKEFPQLRFVDPDDSNATRARIALVQAFALVLSQGLSILGVRAVREMC